MAIWVSRLLSTSASREAPVDNECFSRGQQEILIYRVLKAELDNLGIWACVPGCLGWRWEILIYRLVGAGLGNLGIWAWVLGYLGWPWEILIYMLLRAALGNLGTTLIVRGRFARSARGR